MINFAEPFVYVDPFGAGPRPDEMVGMPPRTEEQGIVSLYRVVWQDALDAARSTKTVENAARSGGKTC
jgi:hypothetical protein